MADRRQRRLSDPVAPATAAAVCRKDGGGPARADSETRAAPTDHDALRLWLRLLACTNRIEAPLRRLLRERFDESLPRFDLMAQLDRHPSGLRMRELSERLMVTGGNVTGLVERLAGEGLVEKLGDPDDRRAWSVHLTDRGRERFRAMASAHEDWVVDLLSGLDGASRQQLYELLGQLKRSLPADRGR
ncbi:MAG: MarR family transcriptional regulator [Rubrivivax sp.]|nr:MarR family transcriptional regulator [Rubrivivax sp.]